MAAKGKPTCTTLCSAGTPWQVIMPRYNSIAYLTCDGRGWLSRRNQHCSRHVEGLTFLLWSFLRPALHCPPSCCRQSTQSSAKRSHSSTLRTSQTCSATLICWAQFSACRLSTFQKAIHTTSLQKKLLKHIGKGSRGARQATKQPVNLKPSCPD